MGGSLHSRSRSGNRKGHHQKRPRQDASGSKRKTEKSHRGKRRYRLRTGQDLHRGELAGGLDGKLRKNQAAPIDLQNLTRLSEKPHQAADRRHPAGRLDLSGLTAVLQAPAGRRASRPHRSQEETKRFSTKDRPQHPPDDRLGVQARYGAEVGEQESNAGLRPAESRTQGDENADRRPAQRLLPGGQGQRRVRALLPRPRHGIAAWGTAGAKVDGCGLPARSTENSESHLSAEWQSGRGTVENEKRLPHPAAVGRRDKRSENAKVQGG